MVLWSERAKWSQFTIRGLLIVTAVVGIVLAHPVILGLACALGMIFLAGISVDCLENRLAGSGGIMRTLGVLLIAWIALIVVVLIALMMLFGILG